MKKILIVLSLLAFLLVLVSCGGNNEYQIVIPENATLTEQYAAM